MCPIFKYQAVQNKIIPKCNFYTRTVRLDYYQYFFLLTHAQLNSWKLYIVKHNCVT